MKKVNLFVVATLTSTMFLASCGNTAEPAAEEAVVVEEAPVVEEVVEVEEVADTTAMVAE